MKNSARGTFEVQRRATAGLEVSAGAGFSHVTFDKQFQGDLVATSVVEMLSMATSVQGSMAYVALEHVTGELAGRSGSFALQHNGVMRRGAAQLTLTVVPDSGSGALTGLEGSFAIEIVEGKHFYTFEYDFAG
jgi:hypothetical protein